MAPTRMITDDSQALSEAALPEGNASNNGLCGLCFEALSINDQLAGGTAHSNISDGKTILDLSGFAYNDWVCYSMGSGFRRKGFLDFSMRDAFGWTSFGPPYPADEGRTGMTQFRRTCAGNKHERLVTLPGMVELSSPGFERCPLCSRLRTLFSEEYAENSWWNEQCSTLRFTIQYEWNELRLSLDGDDEASIPQLKSSLDGLAVYVVRPGQTPNNRDVYVFDVVAWPGPCKKWLKIKYSPLDPEGPMSDRNVDFMKQYIDECINEHSHCTKKSFNSTFVPRRLLDLGDDSPALARLIERGQSLSGRHPGAQLQYATLSYCWGKSLTMTTTKANKFKHEDTGIKVDDMPPTFQDAIHVAKNLGIRYLWIDALCIVQDDTADWEAESVTMCDIFAHSQITISGAKSLSSAQHFLERSVDETLTLYFHSRLEPAVSGEYSICLEPRRGGPRRDDLEGSQWVTRAWVWQEEVMSTRQVVFGNKSLQFRCSEGVFFEDGRRDSNFAMTLTPSASSWYDAISIYSSRKLSVASDRLKAIAGAAKFIESSNLAKGKRTKYLAGLWKNNSFEYQLRWACKEPSMTLTELIQFFQDKKQYIAPSWSWASRNTGVDLPVTCVKTVIRVINSDLRASHEDAMVSVAFGSSIIISGKLRQTPVKPSSGRFATDQGRLSKRWETFSDYGRTDFWLDWVPKEEDAEECLCLLLTSVDDPLSRDDRASAAGLVIAPDLDPETGALFYYRVGVFLHWGDEGMLTSEPNRQFTIR